MPANPNFDAQAYLAQNPYLQTQWNDPETSAQLRRLYPTIEDFAAAQAGQTPDTSGPHATGATYNGVGGANPAASQVPDLSSFAGRYSPQVLQAAQAILAAKPEQIAQNTGPDGQFNLPGFLESTVGWWSSNGNQVSGQLGQFAPELSLLDALGYRVNPAAVGPGVLDPNGGTPLEQGILQTVAPGLLSQIAGDSGRQQTVTDLTNQTNTAYGNLGTVLNQGVAHFDGQAYFRANPDVAAAYQQQGGQQGTGKTVDQFAEAHFNSYGRNEGRQPTYTSDVLQQQQGNAATAATAVTAAASQAAASQLGALQTAIAQSTQNLQGNLAAKGQALAAAVASLNQNLTTLDASQKANLAQQIQTMQQDLQTSIAAQRQALTQEVQQLQGNSTSAAQARSAALTQELAQLNAAQEPLNQARLQGAEALSTAVNLGLTAAQKDILARQASGGFVGGSTMTDAALARATVDARQQAAGAISGANIANAADTREIGVMGATKGYSIADTLASEHQAAANLGATGGAQLSGALAQGTQALSDTGATGLRTIGDTTAAGRAQIGNNAAGQTYADTVGGANSLQGLQDTLSTGGYNIASTLANQTQQAQNNQAAANFTAGQNLFPNSVNAAGALATLPASQATALTSLLPYGNAGTNNALNTLNWWSTQANPPAPTTTLQQPSQTGNGISQLGSGLLGGAFQVGNANNWWQAPSGVGAPTTYANFLRNNPTSSAATGGNPTG